jgi:hypothetical protein
LRSSNAAHAVPTANHFSDMTKFQDRVAGVEIRCEPHARSLLEALRIDALYRQVIRELGRTTGEVSYRDIEDIVIRALLRARRIKGMRHL